ncbi:hypothetical protein J2X68_005677 [Streptomyces sp. 3330]|nr:hypothetical protein [Streptomyces sp. 3330]
MVWQFPRALAPYGARALYAFHTEVHVTAHDSFVRLDDDHPAPSPRRPSRAETAAPTPDGRPAAGPRPAATRRAAPVRRSRDESA